MEKPTKQNESPDESKMQRKHNNFPNYQRFVEEIKRQRAARKNGEGEEGQRE